MPFDGFVTQCMAHELEQLLVGGRVGKIHQPDRDTVIMAIRAAGENHRLLISCNAANPRVHLTATSAENPAIPPLFCMLLRKHLTGGLIRSVHTPGLERILTLEIESEDELGDRSIRKLIVEIMGRHSNIILANRNDVILDAAHHVDQDISRVREVLPARPYVLPPTQEKWNLMVPETLSLLMGTAAQSGRKLDGWLLDHLLGFSPVLCREMCHRAGLDADRAASSLSPAECDRLMASLVELRSMLEQQTLQPCLVGGLNGGRPLDFHSIPLTQYPNLIRTERLSEALDRFYSVREQLERINRQRQDLARVIQTAKDKLEKKKGIHAQTMEDNKDYDKVRLYGELLTANLYALREGMEEAVVQNYYEEDLREVTIPLNPNRSPQWNAQQWFKKYQKSRSAWQYSESQMAGLIAEITYMESVLFNLDTCDSPEELREIRDEMVDQGYIKVKEVKKKNTRKPGKLVTQTDPSSPVHLVSKDGFDIFIGRNNRQNDRLTLKTARAEDVWMHIKSFSGSHVVIRTGGKPVPETTLVEAASYGAWYSRARNTSKAEMDYTFVRHVKKPAGGKPGMVIYVNYATLMVEPKEPTVTRTDA